MTEQRLLPCWVLWDALFNLISVQFSLCLDQLLSVETVFSSHVKTKKNLGRLDDYLAWNVTQAGEAWRVLVGGDCPQASLRRVEWAISAEGWHSFSPLSPGVWNARPPTAWAGKPSPTPGPAPAKRRPFPNAGWVGWENSNKNHIPSVGFDPVGSPQSEEHHEVWVHPVLPHCYGLWGRKSFKHMAA